MISRGIVRYDATMSSSLSDHETGESTICDVPFNETCSATILYEYESLEQNEIGVKVAIGNMLYCQAPLNFLPYILYAAGGVILIGLMTLLLWKLFTFMLDTREFHKFEKERAAAKWAKVKSHYCIYTDIYICMYIRPCIRIAIMHLTILTNF